jgi:hypothetical protein
MTEGLIAAHGEVDKLMPYLHLPVQSGSDRILKAMNRSHTAESYLRLLERFRAARPDIALSGDFIVGFPGETESRVRGDAADRRRGPLCPGFSFKYSPRPGTPAATMDGQVAPEVMDERLQRLQARSTAPARLQPGSVGKRCEVLVERKGGSPASGSASRRGCSRCGSKAKRHRRSGRGRTGRSRAELAQRIWCDAAVCAADRRVGRAIGAPHDDPQIPPAQGKGSPRRGTARRNTAHCRAPPACFARRGLTFPTQWATRPFGPPSQRKLWAATTLPRRHPALSPDPADRRDASRRARAEVEFDEPGLLGALFGQFDANLVQVENRLGVYIARAATRW